MDETMREAYKAYMKDTDVGIMRIIDEMEDRVNEEDS